MAAVILTNTITDCRKEGLPYMYQIAFLLLSVYFLIEGIVSFGFSQMIRMKVRSEDYLFSLLEKAGVYHRSDFKKLQKEDVWIRSRDGLKLHAVMIEPNPSSKRWMIIVHGYTASHFISTQYIQMFQESGFNLLLVDQRRHGMSEGVYTTFGYKEKYDIEAWVEYVNQRAGENCIIGLHGQSFGGGTVLEYSAMAASNIRFIIADCPYSDLTELMKYQLRRVRLYPVSCFYYLVSRRVMKKAGFRFEQVSPTKAVQISDIPTLFIHGTEDRFVPTKMSEDLYRVKKGFKRLLLIEGAVHANAYMVNPQLYRSQVLEFIDEVLEHEHIPLYPASTIPASSASVEQQLRTQWG